MARNILATLLVICLQAGCSQTANLQDPALDMTTTEMVTTLRKPLVFAHENPRLSATGRDYLYLVPVEANRKSRQSLFVWVGLASTIDRRVTRSEVMQPTRIVFEVDGERLVLPLEQWHDANENDPVKVNLSISQSLRTALSVEDFEWLSQASDIQISLSTEQHEQEYTHWRGRWPEWSDIDDDTSIALNVEVR